MRRLILSRPSDPRPAQGAPGRSRSTAAVPASGQFGQPFKVSAQHQCSPLLSPIRCSRFSSFSACFSTSSGMPAVTMAFFSSSTSAAGLRPHPTPSGSAAVARAARAALAFVERRARFSPISLDSLSTSTRRQSAILVRRRTSRRFRGCPAFPRSSRRAGWLPCRPRPPATRCRAPRRPVRQARGAATRSLRSPAP